MIKGKKYQIRDYARAQNRAEKIKEGIILKFFSLISS